MGRDKALLPFDGTSLLEHSLDKLRRAGLIPAVAGAPEGMTTSAPLIPDRWKDCGPLGGIEAALRSLAAQPPQPVLFLPVDLPLLPVAFLSLLCERAQATAAWATVPSVASRPQPLCAVYSSALAPGLAAALDQGGRKVMQVLEQRVPPSRFDLFRVEALVPLESPHRWFTNLNTPADWAVLQSTLGERVPGAK